MLLSSWITKARNAYPMLPEVCLLAFSKKLISLSIKFQTLQTLLSFQLIPLGLKLVFFSMKIDASILYKKDFAGVLTAGKIISVTLLVWLMPTPIQLNNLFWRRLNNHLRPIYLTCRQFLWLLLGFSFPPMLLVRVISDLPSDLYRVYHYYSCPCTSHLWCMVSQERVEN